MFHLIPQLSDAAKVAETMSSYIFEKNNRILKLTSDPAGYYFFLENLEKMNPYFPEIYKDYGLVYQENLKKYWLIEMEKLEALNQHDKAYQLSLNIINSYHKTLKDWVNLSTMWWTLPWKIASVGDYEKELKEALNNISEYARDAGVLPDLLKIENYMKRKDGHLVIVDPLFSDTGDKK